MEILARYFSSIAFMLTSLWVSGQCSFQYISNDTFFQDYIEFIYPEIGADKIQTIGSRFIRSFTDDTTFNAPIFQTFDYCGSILNKVVYQNVDRYKLIHNRIPKSSTYLSEPIGNSAIRLQANEFLLVDKAFDTITNVDNYLIFLKLDEEGKIKHWYTFPVTLDELSLTIKHVLELKDGRILVILWDYLTDNYSFYYFDKNYHLNELRQSVLTRGIRAIKEIGCNEFICTSLKSDSSGFQFYRIDSINQVEWMMSPYRSYGSARDILIKEDKIYIVGSVNFGVVLICNQDGNIIKEYRIDTFPDQRFYSLLLTTNDDIFLSGYITHLNSDKRGEDVAVFHLDSTGKVVEYKLYDFRNSSGTTGYQGFYTDYGGFGIAKANDRGIITFGMSKYYRTRSGGLPHEDALLIKTEPGIISKTKNQFQSEAFKYNLLNNPVDEYMNLTGDTDLIEHFMVYNLNLDEVYSARKWSGPVNVGNLISGIYILKTIDKNNNYHFFKFIKI